MTKLNSSFAKELGLIVIKTISLTCMAGLGFFVLTIPLKYDQYNIPSETITLTTPDPTELYLQDQSPYPTDILATLTPYPTTIITQVPTTQVETTPTYEYSDSHLVDLEPRLFNKSLCYFGLLVTIPPIIATALSFRVINYLRRKIDQYDNK